MLNLTQVDFREVNFIWPEAEQYLRLAVDETTSEESYMRNMKARVFSGANQLWKVADEGGKPIAYAITGIYSPDGTSITAQIYMGAASNMDGFLSVFDQFEVWAKKNGVTFIEVIGRKGWEKKMKPYGFCHNYTALIKHIPKGLH